MVIKKYIAATEEEAAALAKEELGQDAVIMNVKKVSPKGIFKIFKSSTVEITAAVDDYKYDSGRKRTNNTSSNEFDKIQRAIDGENVSPAPDSKAARMEKEIDNLVKRNQIILDDDENESEHRSGDTKDIQKRLTTLQDLIEKQMSSGKEYDKEKTEKKEEKDDKNSQYLNLIKRQLNENEVEDIYIEQIIDDIRDTLNENSTLDNILSNIYQKIVLKIGQPHLIDFSKKYIFFIGPTGVGKTTTIAKIASTLKLANQTKIALVTSDTYRIAAVEQLKTYANILSMPLKVVYNAEEMESIHDEFIDYDLVLIDTAGRSHNNTEQKNDISKLLEQIPEDSKEIFLVLSATTKYKDLVKIVNTYSEIARFNVIFTKLDETESLGNIFNVRMMTGAPLSYTTWGQNVPDDIGKIDAQNIAKQLLGGNS